MLGAKFCVSVLEGFLRAHTPPPFVGEVEYYHEFERGKPRELTELRSHLRFGGFGIPHLCADFAAASWLPPRRRCPLGPQIAARHSLRKRREQTSPLGPQLLACPPRRIRVSSSSSSSSLRDVRAKVSPCRFRIFTFWVQDTIFGLGTPSLKGG